MADIDTIGCVRRRSYLGAKTGSGVYQAIIAAMPPHDTYIEAFLGSGAILKLKAPAARSVGIEICRSVIDAHDYPAETEIICADALSTIAGFGYGRSRVLIYADPPYIEAVAPSSRRYKHRMNENDHAQLIDVLRSVPAAVMLSGYPNALYDRLLADWRTIEFQAMTRGGVRTEKLWCNFPDGAVHWASFAGRNFTDRQRIKRKAQRWGAKFRALPPAERTAVLAALLQDR